MNAEVADCLEQAADLLFTEGWCQGELHSMGQRCILGAICVTNTPQIEDRCVKYEAIESLKRKIRMIENLSEDLYVSTWNDTPGRTADEAIELLKATAKDIRNGELVELA